MTIAPVAVLDQPQLVAPTISLLSAVEVVESATDLGALSRWEAGFKYVPEGCGAYDLQNLCKNDPGGTAGGQGFTKTITAASAPVTGTPYGIVTQYTCSTFSYQWADYSARATRQLIALRSQAIAKELMTDSLGLNIKIPGFGAQVTASGGAIPLQQAIAVAEQTFYDNVPGQRPYIHMRPYMLEAIDGSTGTSNMLHREGNRYYTAMDSVVVADRGYPGTGPAGQVVSSTDEWIYVTGPVQVRMSPITVIPGNLPEATLRTQNQVTFFAEQVVHASFDPTCKTVAVNVKRSA